MFDRRPVLTFCNAPTMDLQDVYALIRTTITPDELDAAETAGAEYAREHPEEEPMVAAAMEMVYMKRESVRLYGVSEHV